LSHLVDEEVRMTSPTDTNDTNSAVRLCPNDYNIRPFIPCGVLRHCGFTREDCAPWKSEHLAVMGLEADNEGCHPHSVPGPDRLNQVSFPQTVQGSFVNGIDVVSRNQINRALALPRRTADTIAKHMVAWLHYRFVRVDYSPQTTDIAELILHRIVHVPRFLTRERI